MSKRRDEARQGRPEKCLEGWRKKSLIKNEKRKNIEWIKCQRLSIIYDDCNKNFLFFARPTSLPPFVHATFQTIQNILLGVEDDDDLVGYICGNWGKGSKKGFFLSSSWNSVDMCRICVRQRKKIGGFINLVQGSTKLWQWIKIECFLCVLHATIESFFLPSQPLGYLLSSLWNVKCCVSNFFLFVVGPRMGWDVDRGGSGGKWWR